MPLPFVKQQDTFAQQTVLQKNVKLMENSRHPVLVKSRMLLLSIEPHWWNHKGGLWRRTDTGADILVNSTFLECK